MSDGQIEDSDEDTCRKPCDLSVGCAACAPYWAQMQAEGYWDMGKHEWTPKGWREITK